MGSRAALLLLGALAATATASDLRYARKLLKAKQVEQRLEGVELLIRLDSEGSIAALEDVIKKSNREMERGSREIDRVLKAQLRLLPAMRRILRELKRGQYSAIDDAERILEKAKAYEDEIAQLQQETRLHLRLVQVAGASFREFRNEKAIAKIEIGARREPNPLVRLFYIAGLRHPSRKRSVPVLVGLLDNKDPRVRAAAVRSLIPFAREPGVTEAVKPLAADENWAVRLGSYQVMAGAALAEALPFLVEAAASESGELALAADAYLEHLTGVSFAQRTGHWRYWWEKNAAAIQAGTWQPQPEKAEATDEPRTVASFFRIPLQSERIVFALDFSGSMSEPLVLKDAGIERMMEKQRLPRTRLGYAKAEFIRAMNALPDGAYFNVLGYNDDVKPFSSNRLVKVTKSSRKAAIRWVLRLETAELTNMFAALDGAFADYLALGGGAHRFEKLPDTVVFLTDGIATRGRFTETDDLRTLVRMWNQPLDIVFHCVGIGKGHDKELLSELASDTGGYYVDVTKGLKSLEPRRRAPPPGVVSAAARRTASKEELEGLLDLLEEGDDDERAKACRELAKLGPGAEPACELLAMALQDISAVVQEAAIEALAAVGAEAVPHLVQALELDDPDSIANAALALHKIGPAAKKALPALEKRKDYDDSRAQRAVREAIAAVQGK